LVPELGNPQALNRYADVCNNPLPHTDPGEHLPVIPLRIAGGMALLEAADHGWTADEARHSSRVMQDPNASSDAWAEATANLALTAAFAAEELDDPLPVGLPPDDLARIGLIGGTKQVKEGVKETREEATECLG
jgi:hypothetical protein